jgi:hypothetical protein
VKKLGVSPSIEEDVGFKEGLSRPVVEGRVEEEMPSVGKEGTMMEKAVVDGNVQERTSKKCNKSPSSIQKTPPLVIAGKGASPTRRHISGGGGSDPLPDSLVFGGKIISKLAPLNFTPLVKGSVSGSLLSMGVGSSYGWGVGNFNEFFLRRNFTYNLLCFSLHL